MILKAIGSFFSKLGLAHFMAGEAFGFSLGATGIGLIALSGVGAIVKLDLLNELSNSP
jgi:hypothetical protein